MSIAMWTLLGFAAWTLIVLIFGVGIRRWSAIFAGKSQLTDFPADTPHGGAAYRRAMRAHANCVENLPVYAAIVLTAELTRLIPAPMNTLALVFIACRVAQSCIHTLLPETNASVFARFLFFFAQIIVMVWMIAAIATLAAACA